MWTDIKTIPDPLEHVIKYVFEKTNAVAEAVLYRYPTYRERTVICISTQSGCPVGCRFCGAGDAFVRSLTAEEIVAQARHCLGEVVAAEGIGADGIKRLQIMFMSMGEPMLNYKALELAIRELHRLYPNAALLISTSGPDVDYGPLTKLSQEVPTVGLQFSVHESTDEARNKLIPFRNKLTLQGISYVGQEWAWQTGRKAFFNYCAHHENVSDKDATRLWTHFPPNAFCATVSVICERSDGLAAKNDVQRQLALDFGDKLLALGYDVRVFDPAGQDTIGGGCGQLHFVQRWFGENADKVRPTAGTGLPQVHVPT